MQRHQFLGRVANGRQVRGEHLQNGQESVVGLAVPLHKRRLAVVTGPPVRDREQPEESVRVIGQQSQHLVQAGRQDFLPPRQRVDVAPQILHLVVAHGEPEILSGYILDVVRFVQNHRPVFGNDAAVFLFLYRQIGEEQMVVDDDQVALHRAHVHLCDEAAVELSALRSGARLAARVELRPGRARFHQVLDRGPVAAVGDLFPLAQDGEVGDLLQTLQNRLFLGVVELLAAQVIRPPFHQAGADAAREKLLQEGNVLEKELFLQVFGPGGDHDAFAREQCGHQVRQRLPRAGARLDDLMPFFGQRFFHRQGHFELSRPELIVGMCAGQRTVAGEKLADRQGRHPAGSVSCHAGR